LNALSAALIERHWRQGGGDWTHDPPRYLSFTVAVPCAAELRRSWIKATTLRAAARAALPGPTPAWRGGLAVGC
jgi:hypothetical protein